jgi:uncharacterized protein (TIGR03086 family)
MAGMGTRGTDPDDVALARVARLAQLGLDREAARLGTATTHRLDANRADDRGGQLDTIEQLDLILPGLKQLAAGVRPEQMDATTPCANFSVRDLYNHMIGGASAFAPQLRGEPAPPAPADGTDLTGSDPNATLLTALDTLDAALKTPGAFERTVTLPFGDVPGVVVAKFLTVDGMVHAWDLAQATGQTYAPDDALAGEVLTTAEELIAPEMRDGDTFADPVPAPAGATNLERLVAFTGRRP